MRVERLPNSISKMPRYFFHLKRGQVLILASNSPISKKLKRRRRDEGKRSLGEALRMEVSPVVLSSSSPMNNGVRSSKCQWMMVTYSCGVGAVMCR
jgi:hypothetical protein